MKKVISSLSIAALAFAAVTPAHAYVLGALDLKVDHSSTHQELNNIHWRDISRRATDRDLVNAMNSPRAVEVYGGDRDVTQQPLTGREYLVRKAFGRNAVRNNQRNFRRQFFRLDTNPRLNVKYRAFSGDKRPTMARIMARMSNAPTLTDRDNTESLRRQNTRWYARGNRDLMRNTTRRVRDQRPVYRTNAYFQQAGNEYMEDAEYVDPEDRPVGAGTDVEEEVMTEDEA